MIPDIAMLAVRRLVGRGAPGREQSDGKMYGRLINGDRGSYLGYATWRKYLKLAAWRRSGSPEGLPVATSAYIGARLAPPRARLSSQPRADATCVPGARMPAHAGLLARGPRR
jgi:hypothetical protein